ncbi:MAG: PepSY domain-containing protein [Caulobacterales bacterium]
MNDPGASRLRNPWPDYNAVWRWHFYAGLLCIPFVLWLSITGAIYVFKPQVEAWLDAPFESRSVVLHPTSPQSQVRAALMDNPGAQFRSYQLPQSPHAAARVLLGRGDRMIRSYVDPADAQVLKSVDEDKRFMNQISFLHGELAIGAAGSAVVEIAACWAIVMILTGLFLWWPRSIKGLGGILFPRLNHGGRFFWRDLHAVTGAWVCALALFLLLSGLPWAKNWGGYLKEVRRLTGTAEAAQDWSTGRASEIAQRRAAATEHADHMPGMMMDMSGDLSALDRLAPVVAAAHLAPPVLISPPKEMGGYWIAKSDAQNRSLRATLELDPDSGAIVGRQNFNQRHPIDQVIGIGISAHEGQLFGWINQLLSLSAAFGLILLCISAGVLWLRRKPSSALGAPQDAARPRFSFGLLGVTVLLAVLFPLFGASLLIVLIVERTMLRRIVRVRQWLGLSAVAQ